MLEAKVAYIDLTTGKITQRPIPDTLRRLYVGGRGLNAYLLYNHVPPGTDPLDPDNVVVLGGGLLCGTPAPSSGRCHLGTKSPLTGLIGSTNMGGFFAPELAFAGFHHLVISGRAERPVYIYINNDEIEIKDGTHLWGKDTFETQKLIREELKNEEVKILCIGQGGENLVRFACVRTGLKNAGGRTGVGCVMGSKNLKAIAVSGNRGLKLADPERALDYCYQLRKQIMSTKLANALAVDGTMFIWNITNTTGLLRLRNFQENRLEDWEELTVDKLHENYKLGMAGCFNCPISCRTKFEIRSGPYAGIIGEGPEYNTQMSFINAGATSWDTILYCQYLCDKYGIDVTEVANRTAWVMELYQRGLIDSQITGGLVLDWDKANEILPLMVEQMCFKKDFGALLSGTVWEAIDALGKESEYYLMHVKGMSNIASDERATPSLALGIATATRGSDHLASRPAIDLMHLPEEVLEELYEGGPMSSDFTSYVGKSRMIWWSERCYAVGDSVGTCKTTFPFFSPHMPKFEEWSQLIKYIAGLDISPDELRLAGERIYTLERMFNYREKGITRKDDYLPERYYREETKGGLPISKGKKIDRKKFDQMLDEYYALHGWDKNGVPTKETLEKLGLDKEPSHLL